MATSSTLRRRILVYGAILPVIAPFLALIGDALIGNALDAIDPITSIVTLSFAAVIHIVAFIVVPLAVATLTGSYILSRMTATTGTGTHRGTELVVRLLSLLSSVGGQFGTYREVVDTGVMRLDECDVCGAKHPDTVGEVRAYRDIRVVFGVGLGTRNSGQVQYCHDCLADADDLSVPIDGMWL